MVLKKKQQPWSLLSHIWQILSNCPLPLLKKRVELSCGDFQNREKSIKTISSSARRDKGWTLNRCLPPSAPSVQAPLSAFAPSFRPVEVRIMERMKKDARTQEPGPVRGSSTSPKSEKPPHHKWKKFTVPGFQASTFFATPN